MQKDVIYFDPLMFISIIFLGFLPTTLIAVLQQNNAALVGKSVLIMMMGIGGLVITLALYAVHQVKLKWIGFGVLLNRNVGLLVLAMLAVTYLSQFFVSAATSVTLGIADVLQGKFWYASVGVWEELAFGVLLFLCVNALLDNVYWTAFNFILNPIIFAAYHLAVLPSSVALLYVLLPRIAWNLVYIFWAVPSPIILTHFVWNFSVASLATAKLSIIALSIFGLVVPGGFLLVLLQCVPAVGLILWRLL